MKEELVCLQVNIVFHGIFFVYYAYKYRFKNLSTILFLLYFLASICSLLYYLTPLYGVSFSNEGTIRFEGLIYYLIANYLLCSSVKKVNLYGCESITNIDTTLLRRIQYFLFYSLGILFVFTIIPVLLRFRGAQDLSLMRDAGYTSVGYQSNFFFVNLILRFLSLCPIVLLFISVFNLCILKQGKAIDKISIVLCLLLYVRTYLQYVARGPLIYCVFDFSIVFAFFFHFIGKTQRRFVLTCSSVIISLFFLMFTVISVARFQDTNSKNILEAASTLRYAGEGAPNFMGLMYDNTTGAAYGYSQFPIFRRIIGLEYKGEAGVNREYYLNYLNKINPNPNYIFYQLIGGLYREWGKYGALIWCLLFNVLFNKMLGNSRQKSFPLLLCGVVYATWVARGVFFMEYASEAGNVLLLLLIYIYIRSRRSKSINIKNPCYEVSVQK